MIPKANYLPCNFRTAPGKPGTSPSSDDLASFAAGAKPACFSAAAYGRNLRPARVPHPDAPPAPA
jgi:hypothetical protein